MAGPAPLERFSVPDDLGPIQASELKQHGSDPAYVMVLAVVSIVALGVAMRLRPSVGAWLRGRAGGAADAAVAISFGALLLLWGVWLAGSLLR